MNVLTREQIVAALGALKERLAARSVRAELYLVGGVSVADDRTLLAMKCAAARTSEDANDIRVLAGRLGLRSSSEVLDVVLAYYPAERLPVRSRLLLAELFDDGP